MINIFAKVAITKEMFTTLAEGKLLTLGSSEKEADCRVRKWEIWKSGRRKKIQFPGKSVIGCDSLPGLGWSRRRIGWKKPDKVHLPLFATPGLLLFFKCDWG